VLAVSADTGRVSPSPIFPIFSGFSFFGLCGDIFGPVQLLLGTFTIKRGLLPKEKSSWNTAKHSIVKQSSITEIKAFGELKIFMSGSD
jgi:hypothetical protein